MTVGLLGYFDSQLKSFVNPHIQPREGWPVYLVPDAVLSSVLNPRTRGISRLGPRRLPALSAWQARPDSALRPRPGLHPPGDHRLHGSRQELSGGRGHRGVDEAGNRGCLLVVDPHGEYGTLDDMHGMPDFAEDSYRPEVKVITADQVYVKAASLTLSDLRYLMSDMGERMDYILSTAFTRVRQESERLHGSPSTGRWMT